MTHPGHCPYCICTLAALVPLAPHEAICSSCHKYYGSMTLTAVRAQRRKDQAANAKREMEYEMNHNPLLWKIIRKTP